MAFLKYARATVVHPHVGRRDWAKVRTAAAKVASADLQGNLEVSCGLKFKGPCLSGCTYCPGGIILLVTPLDLPGVSSCTIKHHHPLLGG